MKNFLDVIKQCPLFNGINENELLKLLECLSAVKKHYKKNDLIFMAGDRIETVGIILSGNVHIIMEDFWGNRTIHAGIEIGGMFGEAFSCAETEKLPISVIAVQSSDILLIDYHKIVTTCSSSCVFHTALIKNMLNILASKNVMLTQKMELLTQRTTREKLLSYLSSQAQKAGGNRFTISFNRQELAEYLSVDQSAMSNELSKMRNDGILNFQRSRFELLKFD